MKETYPQIFQRERRDPGFILEFRNIKQKSSLLLVFTELFYFFSTVKSCSAYFILVQRIERKSGRKKKRETTRTKNINILFLRSCNITTAKARGIRVYWMSSMLIGIDFIYEHNSRSFFFFFSFMQKGPVAQRIRHLTTKQGIPGSNPGGVAVIFLILFSF